MVIVHRLVLSLAPFLVNPGRPRNRTGSGNVFQEPKPELLLCVMKRFVAEKLLNTFLNSFRHGVDILSSSR